MRFFLIHGAYGSPEDNWFPWLKRELEFSGHEVIVPKFPTPDGQNMSNWMQVFEPYLKKVTKDSVIVAHSVGVPFALHILERTGVKVRACFFVAGFTGVLNDNRFDLINRSISCKDFNWNFLRGCSTAFYIYNSKDDPYVPFEKGNELAYNLNVPIIVFRGAGHFNSEAGYNKFNDLLERIKQIL
jgi:hypothetical protein